MNPRERRIFREVLEQKQKLQLEVMGVRDPESLCRAATMVNNLLADAMAAIMAGWRDSRPGA